MATLVKVKKSGSGMAVIIPRQFAEMRKIDVGSVLDLENVKVVKPTRRRYKMSELMAQFKPAHRHGEWDFCEPLGKEIW